MKYFILTLLILFAFQASYAQEEEEQVEVSVIIPGEDSGEIEIIVSNEVGPSFFETDPLGQRLLYFGTQWLISQMIGYKAIVNSPSWNVSQVNSGTETSSNAKGGVEYAIYGSWSNDEGDSFNGDVTVRYDELFSLIEVVSYGFLGEPLEFEELANGEIVQVTEDEPDLGAVFDEDGEEIIAGAWTPIPAEEVENDANLMEIVNQGGQFAIQKAISEGTIPAGSWSAPTLLSAESQVVAGTNYYFTVSFTSDENLEAKAGFFAFEGLDGTSEVITSGFWYLAPSPA